MPSLRQTKISLHAPRFLQAFGHRKGNSLCDINRNARTRTFEWQESSGAGGPCTHIEAIGKVARQGTHSGRSRQRQARSLSASGCCYTLQSRHEGKIRTSDIDWEMQEAGDHSRYAKADCHRKCPSTGSAKMGRISSLTNTDTHRCCVSTAERGTTPCCETSMQKNGEACWEAGNGGSPVRSARCERPAAPAGDCGAICREGAGV